MVPSKWMHKYFKHHNVHLSSSRYITKRITNLKSSIYSSARQWIMFVTNKLLAFIEKSYIL